MATLCQIKAPGPNRQRYPLARQVRKPSCVSYPGRWILLLGCLLLAGLASAGEQSLHDLQGKPRSLVEFEGKWRLFNYWATWCTPCLEEIPELVRFHARHKDRDAVVIGINMEQLDGEALAFFIRELAINYPIWISPPTQQSALGAIPGLPTSFLVSPQGEVVARQVGVVSARMIERFIERQGSRKVEPSHP
ncbi:TlpA family protein disulfide reductase [Sedimenticola thiotaurini]|uniref:TlpA family protein disulfide reductase n=1 Tax=Sedimenticola thiotaurini TaxID=1543721 RepID=UPI0009E2DF6C|nr:TlpA disulfide reductase family protein [Sedimenticola thiotaurini]